MLQDSAVLREGQQVITACAVIYKKINGAVHIALFKRATTKKFMPGIFELIGGHIDFGETLEAGLMREVREEIGMDIVVEEVCHAFTYINTVKKSHSVEVVYCARFPDESAEIVLNPEDHSELVWIQEVDVRSVYELQGRLDDQEYVAVQKAFAIIRSKQS